MNNMLLLYLAGVPFDTLEPFLVAELVLAAVGLIVLVVCLVKVFKG